MALSRYNISSVVENKITSSRASSIIKKLVESGRISTKTVVLKQGQRLDHLAQEHYNNGNLWWVIASASGIGWWLQIPAGTVLKIPLDINDISNIVGD